MATVKTRNTGPEMTVRRALHRLGYRYRTNDKRFAGTPDLCFPGRHKAIFVHGCFWHGHNCRWGTYPKSRIAYWTAKIAANKRRDRQKARQLKKGGWKIMVVWQCDLKKMARIIDKMVKFLEM